MIKPKNEVPQSQNNASVDRRSVEVAIKGCEYAEEEKKAPCTEAVNPIAITE